MITLYVCLISAQQEFPRFVPIISSGHTQCTIIILFYLLHEHKLSRDTTFTETALANNCPSDQNLFSFCDTHYSSVDSSWSSELLSLCSLARTPQFAIAAFSYLKIMVNLQRVNKFILESLFYPFVVNLVIQSI